MNQTYATTRRLVAKETCVKETWTRGGYVKVELVERETCVKETRTGEDLRKGRPEKRRPEDLRQGDLRKGDLRKKDLKNGN